MATQTHAFTGQPPPGYHQAVAGNAAYGPYGGPPPSGPPPGYSKTAAGPGIPASRNQPAPTPGAYGIQTQAQPAVYTTTQSGVPLAVHPAPTVSGGTTNTSD